MLSFSGAYEAVQRILGGPNSRREFVRTYVRPNGGDRLLDVGCGTAAIRGDLGDVTYVGFDPSDDYIATAQERLRDGDQAFVAGIDDVNIEKSPAFDIVLAKGVLHHLEDDQVRRVCDLAFAVLRPGGRFVTFDGAFVDGQNPIARFLISRDRGANVRAPEAYAELARHAFTDVEVHTRHDLLRFPYTHAILVCEKPSAT